MYNLQCDVVGLADAATGKIIAKYLYDAWGKCVSVENADGYTIGTANPFRYRGYYYDNETGFYYLNSRYYNPEVGRFLNADAFASTDITDVLSANMFAYCENNPTNNCDNSGSFCVPAAIVGGFLNAGLAVAGAYMDSFISGEPVDGIGVAIDAIVAFGTGFIQGGFGAGAISNATDVFNVGYTFVTTAANGGTLEEALARSAVTLASSKAGSGLSNNLGRGTADSVMNSIGNAGVQAGANILEDTTDMTINAINGSRNPRNQSRTRPQKTITREVRIHALGAC